MIEINAAILERTFDPLTRKIDAAVAAGVDVIQVDICDGRFVPSKTFMSGAKLLNAKRLGMYIGYKSHLELDMMVDWDAPITGRYERWLDVLNGMGPERIVLHVGSSTRLADVATTLAYENVEIGLGVHLQHSLKDVQRAIEQYPFAYIQVMGIVRVGRGGQALSPKVFGRLKELRGLYPALPLSVDGGVKYENALQLVEAGATRLAIGSGIFDADDVTGQVAAFRELLA